MKKLILILALIFFGGDLLAQVSTQSSPDNIANTIVRRDASGDFDAGNIKGTTLESNSGTTINEFSIDGTLGGDSDDAVPTEKAVKTAIATAVHNPVTLNANATAAGLSLVTQEINYRAATNSQTGYMTAALVGNIETNTLKDTNVPTALETGTVDATTYGITSDGGADDVVLVEATTTTAGLLGADKWDEIVANTLNSTLSAGLSWTLRTSAEDNPWRSVTYGNGLFVAVSNSGSNNRVMTSPDGINWTIRTSVDQAWRSVTYGNGLFVAVATDGTNNRVMTSPDGINWTTQTSAENNDWRSVTYGNGLFVAVANTNTGANDRVMTSPDGENWTIRTSAENNNWYSVTYGNGLFVAVATSNTGSDDRVMTSPDGITWTIRTSAENNNWQSITYGNGLFVAVASSGSDDRVMTSPDGENWTIRVTPVDNDWYSVTYGNGLFVAISKSGGIGDRVMTSPDGENWTIRTSATNNDWQAVTYGNGIFVVVAYSGSSNRVMTSGVQETRELRHDNIYHGGMNIYGDVVGHGTLGLSAGTTVNEFSTDTGLTGDSDDAVPTEKAVKAYVDGQSHMVYPGAGIALSTGSAWSSSITNNSANWNTAYTDRLKWDGGSTDLVPGTGRTSLGGTTIGQAMFVKTNPGAITFGRANADNSFDWLSDADFRTAIGVGVMLWTDDGSQTHLTQQSEPLELRKSGLGHGMTSLTNTDAYFAVKINDAGNGGVTIYGLAGDNLGADDSAISFRAVMVDGTPTNAPMSFAVGKKSSTTWSAYSGTVPAFEWTNGSEQLMAMNTDGDVVIQGTHTLYGEMEAHESGNTLTIGITMQNYGVQGEASAGDLNGFAFQAGSEDDGNAVVRDQIVNGAGLGAGADSLSIWQDGHGLVNGDFVAVQSVNHTGIVKVVRIDADTFHVEIAYVGDEVNTWQEGDYLLASAGTAGKFLGFMSMSFSAGNPTKEYHIHTVQNDTEIDGMSIVETVVATNHSDGSDSAIITVTAGDRFWIVVENETDAENLEYEDLTLLLHKL